MSDSKSILTFILNIGFIYSAYNICSYSEQTQ